MCFFNELSRRFGSGKKFVYMGGGFYCTYDMYIEMQ